MAPKASSQNRLSFRSQSKPKSSFSKGSAKDAIKSKPNPIATSTPPAKASLRTTSPNSTAVKPSSAQKDADSVRRAGLDVDDEKWDSIWRKTKKTMNVPPSKSIHLEHENRVEQILRVFDLNPTFGPCIGVTRLERWQRAKDLDLEPPQEIYDILNTKEGVDRYKENVFTAHGL